MTDDIEILRDAACLLEEGKKISLCTVIEKVGSGPRGIGAKIVVSESGQTIGTIGGGNFERAVINEALKAIEEGNSRKTVFSLRKEKKEGVIETDLICGGELTILIDVIEPNQRLIIIGAGHVALPLSKLADIVGFRITVVDDDEKLTNKNRYPMAENVITGKFSEILDKLDINQNDYVVIVTGDPEHDYTALEKIIKKKPNYVGLLGSKKKITTLLNKLREFGVKERDLKVLHAPLGLDIGAETPEEIGISIIAEMIKERRKKLRSR